MLANLQPVQPHRGEIWFVRMPTYSSDKKARPAIVVSLDGRNLNPRSKTALVISLSTTVSEFHTHIRLEPGETGLAEASEAQAENITVARKESMAPARSTLRTLGAARIRQIARCVLLAMGVLPTEVPPT